MAIWLDNAFAGYDHAILSLLHSISCGFLTFISKVITFLGEKGIIFFLLALALMCFKRTRKFGICLFGAVACGALITNIILKDTVERLRPFEASDVYRQWWESIGSPAEDGFSFPSGHATAAAAGVTAICLMKGKKWIGPGALWVLLMMISRNYLMAHYPSDVLFGSLIGVASGFIAWYITRFIYRFLATNYSKKWAKTIVDFNLPVTLPAFISGQRKDGEGTADDYGREYVEETPAPRHSNPGYVGKHEKR